MNDADNYVPDFTTPEGCAMELCYALCSDSGIPVLDTEKPMLVALKRDIAAGASLPTKEDIDGLVMGDDDGEIPEALTRRYPRVNRFIGSFF